MFLRHQGGHQIDLVHHIERLLVNAGQQNIGALLFQTENGVFERIQARLIHIRHALHADDENARVFIERGDDIAKVRRRAKKERAVKVLDVNSAAVLTLNIGLVVPRHVGPRNRDRLDRTVGLGQIAGLLHKQQTRQH